MRIGIVSLFPEMFAALTEHGVTGRAHRRGLYCLSTVNPRDFAEDRHRTVDDKPYGGGPGMLMKVAPVRRAIVEAKQWAASTVSAVGAVDDAPKVIYLSPRGRTLTQAKAKSLANEKAIVLLCGRYEGVDQRVIDIDVDEELSVGDYVLSGGELPAMVLLDAMIRWLPDALGDDQSAQADSFAAGEGRLMLDCPHYTRPEVIEGRAVPNVLLSGDHQAIARWRLRQSLLATKARRPDIFAQLQLSDEELELLNETDV